MKINRRKMAAVVLSAVVALSAVRVPVIQATQVVNETKKIALSDGIYSVELSMLKLTDDTNSEAADYFNDKNKTPAVMTIKDGIAKVSLTYSNSMIGNPQQVLDSGNEVLEVKEENGVKKVEVTFTELDETVKLAIDISITPTFVMSQQFRILLKQDTITPIGDMVTNNGIYEVKTYLWHASMNQSSMAGKALEEKARIKVEDGQKKMYLYTTKMQMGTITAYLQELKVMQADGTYAEAEIEGRDAQGNPNCFSFILPSDEEYIKVKVNPHVAIMGNTDIDARLKIDYSYYVKVDDATDLKVSPLLTVNGNTTDDLTQNNPTQNGPVQSPTPTNAPEASVTPAPTKQPSTEKTKKEESSKEESAESNKSEQSSASQSENKNNSATNSTNSTSNKTVSSVVTTSTGTVANTTESVTEESNEEAQAAEDEEAAAEITEEEFKETASKETSQKEEAEEQVTTSKTTKMKENHPLKAASAASGAMFAGIALWTSRFKIRGLLKKR